MVKKTSEFSKKGISTLKEKLCTCLFLNKISSKKWVGCVFFFWVGKVISTCKIQKNNKKNLFNFFVKHLFQRENAILRKKISALDCYFLNIHYKDSGGGWGSSLSEGIQNVTSHSKLKRGFLIEEGTIKVMRGHNVMRVLIKKVTHNVMRGS